MEKIRVMKSRSLSVDTKIMNRIRGHGRGWVFTPADFADLGSRDAIASALKRRKAQGTIRHLAQGLYDIPKTHPKFGAVWPSADAAVSAIGRRDGLRLQPSGAHAAHGLGLTDQVPMRPLYLTDGAPRKLALGNLNIVLKQTTPKNLATADRVSGDVIQALRWLGKDNVGATAVRQLQNRLDSDAKVQLQRDAHLAPGWIGKVMRQVASPVDA